MLEDVLNGGRVVAVSSHFDLLGEVLWYFQSLRNLSIDPSDLINKVCEHASMYDSVVS